MKKPKKCKECGVEFEVKYFCQAHCSPKCMNKHKLKLSSKKEKKVTGEGALFMEIWLERPHRSELSGEDLGNIMKPIFFSHILPKSGYSQWRLNKDNIILLTAHEHTDWHSIARSDLVKRDVRWQKIIDRYNLLREEYVSLFGS